MLSPARLRLRSGLLQSLRSFFLARGYIEVDTPVRLPVLLPESHIIPFASEDRYLQTSPEICMKLLLAVGSPDLFQICRCFRKEEEGRLHQNEFAMLEWYHRGWSYRELMEECEELLQHVAVSGGPFPAVSGRALLRQEKTISLASPWDRFTVDEVFREYAGVGAREAVRKNMFDELLITRVEPRLGWERPAFLHDYPVELGSLARGKKEDDTVAERFELYIAGIELVNGFSELVDPVEQRRRFAEEIARIGQAGRIADMPEKFLADLAVMGQSAGAALGLDRVFMLLLGADAIAEAVTLNEEDV